MSGMLEQEDWRDSRLSRVGVRACGAWSVEVGTSSIVSRTNASRTTFRLGTLAPGEIFDSTLPRQLPNAQRERIRDCATAEQLYASTAALLGRQYKVFPPLEPVRL